MIKKGLLKKVVVLSLVASMSVTLTSVTAFAAEKETTKEEETVEAETAPTTDANEEDVDKETTEEVTEGEEETDNENTTDPTENTETNTDDSSDKNDNIKVENGINGKYRCKLSNFECMWYYIGKNNEFIMDGEELKRVPIEEGEEINKTLSTAISDCIIEIKDHKIKRTFYVKPFTFLGKETYLSNISVDFAKINKFPGTEDNDDSTKECSIISKDQNGHPTAFSIEYNMDEVEPYYAGYKFFLNGKEEGYAVEFDENYEYIGEVDNSNVSKEDGEKKADAVEKIMNDNSKKRPEPTNTAKQTKKDSSPKTGDSMSTGVMIATIVGGVSLLSLAGFVVYKRKRNCA